MKPRLSERTRALLDAAGRPIVGYVKRKRSGQQEWVARTVRYFRPVHLRYGHGRLMARSKILFVGAGAKMWIDSREVFAPPRPGMPDVSLMKALRVFSHDHWWVSAGGTLERRATLYEERMPEHPPRQGWTLMTSGAAMGLLGFVKNTNHPRSPSEADHSYDEAAKLATWRRALERARAKLARYERQLQSRQHFVDKWRQNVAKLEELLKKPKSDFPLSPREDEQGQDTTRQNHDSD